jgi:plastocyanin
MIACGGTDMSSPLPDPSPGAVTVGGGIQFTSRHNGTSNPAVDTVNVGDAVTWTWTGNLPHSVRSIGTSTFPSSATLTGSGTHRVQFTTPGTYRYDCAVHGAAMSGTVVVLGETQGTQSLTDPLGDTFGASEPQWDLTAMTVTRADGGIIVRLDFLNDVSSPLSGDGAIIGRVDLDLDQNPGTGQHSIVDLLHQDGGSTGLGVEASILFGPAFGDSSAVLDVHGHDLGRAESFFVGHRITIKVPRALLGDDDGYLNAAVVVGHDGGATDFAPQSGHLTVGELARVLASR